MVPEGHDNIGALMSGAAVGLVRRVGRVGQIKNGLFYGSHADLTAHALMCYIIRT